MMIFLPLELSADLLQLIKRPSVAVTEGRFNSGLFSGDRSGLLLAQAAFLGQVQDFIDVAFLAPAFDQDLAE